MPLTGVGKIYKPALRREAAQRAFEAAIAPLREEGTAAAVTVRDDPSHGMLAAVQVSAPAGVSPSKFHQGARGSSRTLGSAKGTLPLAVVTDAR